MLYVKKHLNKICIKNGDGVKRDYEASATWQKKLLDIYRERYMNGVSEKSYYDFSP